MNLIKYLKYIYLITGLVVAKKKFVFFLKRLFRKKIYNKFDFITFSLKEREVFFGYYDLTPISDNNQKILSLSHKKNDSFVEIGYFNINQPNNFVKIGQSNLWCWQQGSRLRWSKKDNSNVYYNCIVNDNYGAVLQNIYSKKILMKINYPLYDITSNERYGLSLNFSRLQRLRPGYGYSICADSTISKLAPNDDGIFLIDLHNNTSKLILDIASISKIKSNIKFTSFNHYFNHISINPSGTRFLFFHLWANSFTRKSRLFTSNIDGTDLYLLEDNENVSHYSWINDSEIILTTSSKKNGIRYRIYKDKSKIIRNLSEKLNYDGHPSFNNTNSQIFVSDSYPDKFSDRELFVYNIRESQKTSLLKLYSPLKYRNDYRCDLHPRWSVDGNLISFDSTHTGKRTINLFNFKKIF